MVFVWRKTSRECNLLGQGRETLAGASIAIYGLAHPTFIAL